MDQNSENIVWSITHLTYLNFNAFYSSLDNLLQDAIENIFSGYIYSFQKGVDNFELEHKTC